jgi:hypothetical protein
MWGSRGPLRGNSCPYLAGKHILEHAFNIILAETFGGIWCKRFGGNVFAESGVNGFSV